MPPIGRAVPFTGQCLQELLIFRVLFWKDILSCFVWEFNGWFAKCLLHLDHSFIHWISLLGFEYNKEYEFVVLVNEFELHTNIVYNFDLKLFVTSCKFASFWSCSVKISWILFALLLEIGSLGTCKHSIIIEFTSPSLLRHSIGWRWWWAECHSSRQRLQF